MGTIPGSIGVRWPQIAGDFPANQSFDSDTALIWADGGARAAALFAGEARDAANAAGQVAGQALAAINALAAHVGIPIPAPLDVNALAAALGPLLHPTTDVDALVAALLPHLPADADGPVDPVAFADALIAHLKIVP